MQNIDNITRSLEEDLLQDVANKNVPLLMAGIDAFDDVSVLNGRLQTINTKFKSLISLLYLKESSVLDVRRDDPIKGSIFFNKETNCIEYYDGQAWKSNIFSPNNVITSGNYSINDLEYNEQNGIKYANVSNIYTNTQISDEHIVFIVADGDLLDQSMYYIDKKDAKRIILNTPITIYQNLSYYVLGSVEKYSSSIPKFEECSFTSDGSRTVYPLSTNDNFVATYRSSVQVYVNGACLPTKDYDLSLSKNKIILKTAPEVGATVDIRTLYGVETDFRGSVSYIEQIEKATVAGQKTFRFTGVSDAIKVYLDGKRLVLNEHFKFNYVQKLVVLNDDVAATVKENSLVIIEKEMAPMSKQPMYGKLITELKTLVNGSATLDFSCNGISNVCVLEREGGPVTKTLSSGEYFVNDRVINITGPEYATANIQVSYLTNSEVEQRLIPELDDFAETGSNKVWSIDKINEKLNGKMDSGGNRYSDVNFRNIHSYGNSIIDGDLTVGNNFVNHGKLETMGITVGEDQNPIIKTDSDSNSIILNRRVNVKENLVIYGNLEVKGKYTGTTSEIVDIGKNEIVMNSKITTEPVPELTSFIIHRGNSKPRAYLQFIDSKEAFFIRIGDADPKQISLEGHTHTVVDITGDFAPSSKRITNYKLTSDSDVEDNAIKLKLEEVVTNSSPLKSIGVLSVNKTKVLGNSEQDSEIMSGSRLEYRLSESDYSTGRKITTQITPFTVIEDGSVVIDSKNALVLPQGDDTTKWETTANALQQNQVITTYPELDSKSKLLARNGLIRYNTTRKCIEMKIDGSWVQFYKPDLPKTKLNNCDFQRKRFIKEFNSSDFTTINTASISGNFGLENGEKGLIIEHNLNSIYVRVDIFDDKRTSFPLLYKCIDENRVILTFPSNIEEMAKSPDINEWFKYLAAPLHRDVSSEGPGHENKVNTSKTLNTSKKFVAFINEL